MSGDSYVPATQPAAMPFELADALAEWDARDREAKAAKEQAFRLKTEASAAFVAFVAAREEQHTAAHEASREAFDALRAVEAERDVAWGRVSEIVKRLGREMGETGHVQG